VDLVAAGSLVLTGAAADAEPAGAILAGAGAVKFGNASIVGGEGGWQAVGANETITFAVATTGAAAPTITGTAAGAKLVGGDGAGAISVGGAAAANADLTVTKAELDLTAGGSVVINITDAASLVTLATSSGSTTGTLTFNAEAGDTDVTDTNRAKIHQDGSDAKAAIAGNSITVKGTNAKDSAVNFIAGGTNAATITAGTTGNPVILDNTAIVGD
jgi:hypothetical protein